MIFPKLDDKKLFDSHAHISSHDFVKEIDEVISYAKEVGLDGIVDIAVDIESSKQSLELSKRYNGFVYSTIGIDPEVFIAGSPLFVGLDKKNTWFDEMKEQLSQLIKTYPNEIVGIGESGIDHYHNQVNFEGKKLSGSDLTMSNDLQKKLFEKHLELGEEFNLPLSIHSRNAEDLCIDIVSNYSAKGVFHSFTGNFEQAKKIIDLGWGLGVNGIITFKNATELREVYKRLLGCVAIDTSVDFFYNKGIYFETDSPFLSPEGKRGERNVPANVKIIYDTFREFLSKP